MRLYRSTNFQFVPYNRKPMKFYKRSHIYWSIVLLGIIVQSVYLTFSGCSHTSPYYHQDIPALERQDVEIENNLQYRILLLGDGGQPKPDEPVLKTLKKWAQKEPEKTSIIFLGDNMYPDGMTTERQHEASTRLGPQLEVVKSTGTHGLFIPGNHDWGGTGEEGLRALLAQEKYVNNALSRKPSFLPEAGYPGPVTLELPESSPTVRLVVLDTQWWLHKYEKPEKPQDEIITELKNALDTGLPLIVVGHHPIQSYGPHGGFYDWKAHLFPLTEAEKWLWIPVPIIGSLYPVTRWHLVKSEQDLCNATYKDMVEQFNSVFSDANKTPLLIYASGHDHSLQVLQGDTTDYLLISGLASSEKATEVSHGDNTLFAHQHSGFMVLDFLEDGKVLLRVIEPVAKEVLFHHWLK